MKHLLSRIDEIRRKSLDIISKENRVLCSDYDDNFFYELPVVSIVDKYGYYCEWAVVEVRDMKLIGIGKGEESGQREFELEELDAVNASALADLINEFKERT